jgi:hypothetical protein
MIVVAETTPLRSLIAESIQADEFRLCDICESCPIPT